MAFATRCRQAGVDLADRAVEPNRYPANAVNEAQNGKYRIYAIDPDNLSDQGANALMNIVEIPQTAAVTSAVLARSMKEMAALARARGLTWTTLDIRVAKLRDVDIGIVDSTLRTGTGTLRLVQYFIPGRETSAALTYGCKPEEFGRYRPIFEASAMATTGAYSHSFDWRRVMKAAFFGAVVCSLLALFAIAIIRRVSAAPARPR